MTPATITSSSDVQAPSYSADSSSANNQILHLLSGSDDKLAPSYNKQLIDAVAAAAVGMEYSTWWFYIMRFLLNNLTLITVVIHFFPLFFAEEEEKDERPLTSNSIDDTDVVTVITLDQVLCGLLGIGEVEPRYIPNASWFSHFSTTIGWTRWQHTIKKWIDRVAFFLKNERTTLKYEPFPSFI